MWLEWDESDKSERRGKGRGCYSILDFFSPIKGWIISRMLLLLIII